ncbi:MAG: prepilin-type N-terminal cleavage/methylation domain-containing protein [Candidatus Omnitrophica bacterium]|nr:prepilin-type N-terminal cleavage/methylation domain-containing protein [Candidatus Omnitrophota bacterium]
MKNRKGFTLVEIMIVVAIIALLAAIAIPNLLRARVNANQAAAQAALQTISTAMESLRSTSGSYQMTPGGAAATLAGLSGANPPYIDATLGCGAPPCAKSGYNFGELVVAANNQEFMASCVPVAANVTGVASYCVQGDGVIRVDPNGGAIATAAVCAALNPTQ